MALELHFKLSLLLDLLLSSRTAGARQGFAKLESLQLCILHLSQGSLLCSPGEALAVDGMAWLYEEIFFFLACVAPSSSSEGSDHVVLPVSLPTLPELERRAGEGH